MPLTQFQENDLLLRKIAYNLVKASRVFRGETPVCIGILSAKESQLCVAIREVLEMVNDQQIPDASCLADSFARGELIPNMNR